MTPMTVREMLELIEETRRLYPGVMDYLVTTAVTKHGIPDEDCEVTIDHTSGILLVSLT